MDQDEQPQENQQTEQSPVTQHQLPQNWYKLATIGLVLLILLGVAYYSGTRNIFNNGRVAPYVIPPTGLPITLSTTPIEPSSTKQNPTSEELFAIVSQHKAELLKGVDAVDLKYNQSRLIGTDLYMIDFVYIKQDGSTLPSEGGHVLVGKTGGNWVVAIGLPTDPYYCQWISQSNLSEADKNYFRSNSACQ